MYSGAFTTSIFEIDHENVSDPYNIHYRKRCRWQDLVTVLVVRWNARWDAKWNVASSPSSVGT